MNNSPAVAMLSLACALALSTTTTLGGEDRRPNLIIILTDDQGWGDLSCHGNTNLATPNVDRLAREGASFQRFYVQPVCSPTRAELLTGLYHPRVGVGGVTRGHERMEPGVPTIASLFQDAGYRTAAFGKWHNGTQAPYHPTCRGFEQFYGFCSGHWGHYFSPLLDHNGLVVQGEGYVSDDFTDHAIEFIAQDPAAPFFMLLAYNTPHSPMQVPDRWWQRHASKQLEQRGTLAGKEDPAHTRAALAMCENIDWNVGRLVDAITGQGIEDDTVVVYLSDNGPNGHRWNGGMRGIKGSTDEGGVRSPLFIKWPAKIAAGLVVTPNAAVIDLLPTLCDLANLSVPDVDGRSLRPLLEGNQKDWAQRIVYTHWGDRVAARLGQLVLDDQGRLYDLDADPGQQMDLSMVEFEVTEHLQQAVDTWRRSVLQPSRGDTKPFVVGHPELLVTQLPARDATGTGNLQRSSQHPNSSFFTHWKTTDDTLVWPVDVVESGRFRATVYYTCDEGNEGSTIALRFKDTTLISRVSRPSPSPLIGQAEDRVVRQESYEQQWAPLVLGEITLGQGKGTLTVEATEVAGSEVMDFRLLTLERLAR